MITLQVCQFNEETTTTKDLPEFTYVTNIKIHLNCVSVCLQINSLVVFLIIITFMKVKTKK